MEILHVLSDHTWFTLIFSERNTCLKPMHISACQITNMQKSSCFSSFYYPFVCVILGLLCWSLLNWSGCEFIDEHIMIGLCEELSTVSWVLMHHCLMLISWANLILFVGFFFFALLLLLFLIGSKTNVACECILHFFNHCSDKCRDKPTSVTARQEVH